MTETLTPRELSGKRSLLSGGERLERSDLGLASGDRSWLPGLAFPQVHSTRTGGRT
jgi:hypothetical protein